MISYMINYSYAIFNGFNIDISFILADLYIKIYLQSYN